MHASEKRLGATGDDIDTKKILEKGSGQVKWGEGKESKKNNQATQRLGRSGQIVFGFGLYLCSLCGYGRRGGGAGLVTATSCTLNIQHILDGARYELLRLLLLQLEFVYG